MSDRHNPVLSSGDNDATRAYLFESINDPSTHAVTRDVRGSNLPCAGEHGGWTFDREFALGVREVMPINIAPEPVLRGLVADGYFVWSDRSNPKGTSQ
jgi:hypothetical protein